MALRQAEYVLGHTSVEQQRLIRQARVLAPLTERFLRDAGISSGMRVLDIGCGVGDVSMIAAQLVGTAGHVTSIDLDQASIETAQRRAAAFGLENTSFNRADIAEYVPPNLFDAIVGRLVLQFLPDPAAVIKRLYGMLKPGGILALQESTWKLWLTYTAHLPLRLSVTKAARDAFQAGGASTEMELQLYQGFVACGLQAPQLRVEVPLGNSPEFRSLLPDLLAAVMPTIIAKGLTIDHLGDLNTLRDRLDHELDKENSFASFAALIGVLGHKQIRDFRSLAHRVDIGCLLLRRSWGLSGHDQWRAQYRHRAGCGRLLSCAKGEPRLNQS